MIALSVRKFVMKYGVAGSAWPGLVVGKGTRVSCHYLATLVNLVRVRAISPWKHGRLQHLRVARRRGRGRPGGTWQRAQRLGPPRARPLRRWRRCDCKPWPGAWRRLALSPRSMRRSPAAAGRPCTRHATASITVVLGLQDVWGLRTGDMERFCAAAGADTACTVQGNLLNVVKSAPQKAIDFYAFDLFKVFS